MRVGVVGATICLCIVGMANAGDVKAAIRKSTDIPTQGLGPALTTLAKEFDFQVLYRTEIVEGRISHGVSGAMTAAEALDHVLSGTGLTYKYLDDKTVTILPVSASGASDSSQTGVVPPAKEGKKNSSEGFRVAQVDQGANSQSAAVGSNASTPQTGSDQVKLEEILVTAQKREERLQDVPVPVTALGAGPLVEHDQLKIQDYFSMVPNFNVSPASTSSQFLSIRGITTGGYSTPTVAVTIDDVPFTGSRAFVGGNTVPDLDPGDLARIEVLRGPQGALYGASSMGGLLKYVTVDPTTESLSGRVQVGTTAVQNGDGLGYNVRGSVNVPLGDYLAVRASGFTRQEPGYIDNPVLGTTGINESRASGGRLSALWRPSDILSLKLSAMYQSIRGDGSDAVEIGLNGSRDLQQNDLRGTGWYDRKVQAYSAILTANLGTFTVVSDTGYNINSTVDSLDSSYLFSGFGIPNSSIISTQRYEKFSQEVRVSTPIGTRFDAMLGGFYTHELSDPFVQTGYVTDPVTGALGSQIFSGALPETYGEYALFGNLTYKVTDRLDIQLGGRESWIRLSDVFVGTDVDIGSYDLNTKTKNDVFTYLLTPRFRISPDLMVYARFASGFRSGETNPPAIAARGLPGNSSPDKTRNYELGLKGDFFDHMASMSASFYYIDWSDIQSQLLSAPAGKSPHTYKANGGSARSDGLELSAEVRPLKGTTIAAWVTVGEAVLTTDFPASSTASGKSGDRLPDSARVSGSLSIDQEFPLGSRVKGSAGASLNYVGDRIGVFGTTDAPERQNYPGYTKFDLRTGLEYDAWKASLYINNVTDRRGAIGGGIGAIPPFTIYYIQPRTAGLSISRAF